MASTITLFLGGIMIGMAAASLVEDHVVPEADFIESKALAHKLQDEKDFQRILRGEEEDMDKKSGWTGLDGHTELSPLENTNFGSNCLTLKAYALNARDDLWDANTVAPGYGVVEILTPILESLGNPDNKNKGNSRDECIANLLALMKKLSEDPKLAKTSIGRVMLEAIHKAFTSGNGILVWGSLEASISIQGEEKVHPGEWTYIDAEVIGWHGKNVQILQQLAVPGNSVMSTAAEMMKASEADSFHVKKERAETVDSAMDSLSKEEKHSLFNWGGDFVQINWTKMKKTLTALTSA